MKEGWVYRKFKDISHSISDGDWIEKKDQSYSGIRLIQTGNIGVGKFIPKDDSPKFIAEDTFKRLRCSEIFEGDVLISRLPNPLGRSCILPKLDTRCITAVDCSIVRIKKDVISPDFFIYYTQSQGYFSKIDRESSGTTRARITRKKLEQTEIPVPPLSEQQSIVDYLDSAFAKIDAMKANAEKALNEAKALFQASLKEMLEPKEGWEEKALGEVSVFSQGIQVDVNLQTEQYSPGKVRFLRIIDVTQGNVPPRYIDDPGERYYLKADEIAMVRYGTVGFVCYGFEGVIANNLFKISIKDKSKLQSNYLQYFLKSDLFQSHIRKGVGGAALPAIKFGDIKHIILGIPPVVEQQSIVATLDSLKSKVDRLQDNYDKISQECDALKQAILRQVFE